MNTKNPQRISKIKFNKFKDKKVCTLRKIRSFLISAMDFFVHQTVISKKKLATSYWKVTRSVPKKVKKLNKAGLT